MCDRLPSNSGMVAVIYYCTETQQHGIYFFYIIEEQNIANSNIIIDHK